MELRLEKSGDQEMKWSQQLSALDLMFWYEETNDAKKKELQSVDEYKEYLKEQGYAEGRLTKDIKRSVISVGYRNQNSKERCKWKICNDRSKDQ